MIRISNRYSHFLFSAIQSGMTCGIAAAIASVPFYAEGAFLSHWAYTYLVSWVVMLPVALAASPFIRKLAEFLTS